MFRLFDQYVSRQALLLVFGDSAAIAVSILIAYWIRFRGDPESLSFYLQQPDITYRGLTIVGLFQICAYYNELYQTEGRQGTADQFFRLAQAIGVGCFLLAAVYYVAPQLSVGRGVFALTLILILASTTALRWITDSVWGANSRGRPVLILGTERLARSVAEEIIQRNDLGMVLVGFVGCSPAADLPAPVVGLADDVESLVALHNVRVVLVANDNDVEKAPFATLLRLKTRGVRIEDARAALAAFTGKISIDSVRSSWFVYGEGFSRSDYAIAFKRLTDLLFGIVGLVLASPIMILVSLAVRLDSRGPALFRQKRTGLHGEDFEVLKFRTMRVDAEIDGVPRWATEDDPRITRIGKHLRVYRLDELPQFINVIRGHMSFVGPRPERPEFVGQIIEVEPLYSERHTLRPGLTGWAQVCYPYGANLDDSIRKLEYDLFYLKNVSFLFDLAIIFQTVKIVLWGRGR
jgi:sugar transferase (PEP-CTERM system associated)